MRFHRVLYVFVAVLAFTPGCDKPCNPACGANQVCVSGSCESCGLLGNPCCPSNTGHGTCDQGQGVCNDEINASCTNDCGTVGKPCCDNACPGGGACNASGTCDEIPGVCLGGSVQHTIDVIDGTCQIHPVTIWVNSLNDVPACVAALESQLDPGGANQLQFCPVDTQPSASPVCETVSKLNVSLWNCGTQQLSICEANLCPGGPNNCAWVDGGCPP